MVPCFMSGMLSSGWLDEKDAACAVACICAMRAEECSESAETLGRPTYIGRKFVVCIAVGREGLRYRSRMESGGLNGRHTVWLIRSRGIEMNLPGQAEKTKICRNACPSYSALL